LVSFAPNTDSFGKIAHATFKGQKLEQIFVRFSVSSTADCLTRKGKKAIFSRLSRLPKHHKIKRKNKFLNVSKYIKEFF
jgi:hypothetical protein